jgi:peptidoglycan/LPS O-acetylase OafA/YrhL
LTLSVLTCSSALLVSLSILACVAGRIERVPRVIGYLSAASFWVYLVHHPVVGLVHIDMKWLSPNSGAIVKTTIVFLLTSGFCLLSYEGLVRRSALGRWLGMGWKMSPPVHRSGQIPAVDDASGNTDHALPEEERRSNRRVAA